MQIHTPILGPAGNPVYAYGRDTWREIDCGEYIVSIEWLTDSRSAEPVMLIRPAHLGDAGVFGIALSSIGKYADPSGHPSDDGDGWLAILNVLPMLGKPRTQDEAFRLMDVILRCTPDLIKCPVAPMDVRRSDGGGPLLEITRTDENGKVLAEVSV